MEGRGGGARVRRGTPSGPSGKKLAPSSYRGAADGGRIRSAKQTIRARPSVKKTGQEEGRMLVNFKADLT